MVTGKYESSALPMAELSKRRARAKKKPQIVRTIQRTFRRAQKQFKLNRQNGVAWFWDLRMWLPLIVVLFIVNSYALSQKTAPEIPLAPEAAFEREAVIPFEDAENEESSLDEEAVALSRLADSVAGYHSDNVKRVIMWIAINRSEDRANGYGESLISEINRPKQWQSYNPESFYTERTYQLALEVLAQWRSNGARPVYNDMLWFCFNADGSITVRNRFKAEKNRVELTLE